MDVRSVLNRIKQLEGIRFDKYLPTIFDASRNTINNWKQRNSIPGPHLISYCKRTGHSLDYVVFGRGRPEAPSGKVEHPSDYALRQVRMYSITGLAYGAVQRSQRRVSGDEFERLLHILHELQSSGTALDDDTVDDLLENMEASG